MRGIQMKTHPHAYMAKTYSVKGIKRENNQNMSSIEVLWSLIKVLYWPNMKIIIVGLRTQTAWSKSRMALIKEKPNTDSLIERADYPMCPWNIYKGLHNLKRLFQKSRAPKTDHVLNGATNSKKNLTTLRTALRCGVLQKRTLQFIFLFSMLCRHGNLTFPS